MAEGESAGRAPEIAVGDTVGAKTRSNRGAGGGVGVVLVQICPVRIDGVQLDIVKIVRWK